MKAIFVAKHSLGSWLIRAITWGRFSHVAILLDEDTVIHSTFLKGVHVMSKSEFLKQYYRSEEVYISLPDENLAIEWLKSQIGVKYDILYILGFILRKENLQDETKPVCHELLEIACEKAGKRRVRANSGRLTPQISYMISVDEYETESK